MISLLEPKRINIIKKVENNDSIINKKNNYYINPNIENLLKERNIKIIGKIDSKFYLIKKIGKGSSGKVYIGVSIEEIENKEINEDIKYYSIKVIEPIKTDISMFKNEVQLLENIEHKNVVKIYAYGLGIKSKIKEDEIKEKEIFYIVMEYIEHGELLNYITKISKMETKGFGEEFGRLILSQLLDGLEELHSRNIFHRDIKLENIMLGNNCIFKYVDFGFCTNEIGLLNSYLGTPSYAAPELHSKKEYFAKSEDIFSLGVTLFIIVTGSLPFKIATFNDTFYQFIIKGDYIGFWKRRMINVSPSFMELFDNMIAYDFSQRPSISEIRLSPWMKDINYDLLPLLKKELSFREKLMENLKNEEKIREIKLKENKNKFSLLETKKPVYVNADINDNNININGFKNENTNEYKEKNEIKIKKEEINNIYIIQNNFNINESNKGFIKVKIKSKNNNIIFSKIKKFLKSKGNYKAKNSSNEYELLISNGELDILLKLEKYNKIYSKLYYYKIKGVSNKFETFKKIINLLKDKLL